ncbi:MAG: hypothetical protein JWM28_3528 [Chitinophagaceae bacterium]|nr:hypothetical protein [Chitinophagaceae bacterium]
MNVCIEYIEWGKGYKGGESVVYRYGSYAAYFYSLQKKGFTPILWHPTFYI